MPPPATLCEVADHIDEIIGSGSHSQRKALIEALVAQVKITAPGRIVPVFRIPQATDTGHADNNGEGSGVRAMTNLVGRLGLEPRTHGLKVRCSTIELTPRLRPGSKRQRWKRTESRLRLGQMYRFAEVRVDTVALPSLLGSPLAPVDAGTGR